MNRNQTKIRIEQRLTSKNYKYPSSNILALQTKLVLKREWEN